MRTRTRSLLIAASVFLAGALWLSHRSGPPSTDAAGVHRLVAAGAQLVDVRTPEEFASGHLPGARNIPIDELDARLGEVGRRDQPIVVYCATGGRSAGAARMLAGAGFTQVHDLGPMSAW